MAIKRCNDPLDKPGNVRLALAEALRPGNIPRRTTTADTLAPAMVIHQPSLVTL